MQPTSFFPNRLNTVSNSKSVVIVCAPTACGKTAFAEAIFAADASSPFAGKAEIISADSMQVYRGFNIGTAKPSSDFLRKLPHRLIDIRNADESFGAGDFVNESLACCDDMYERGKVPVIVGGTAFYIRNFIYGLPPTPRSDDRVRRKIAERMQTEGAQKLWNELCELDPASAKKIHIHDEYRIKRALEVYAASGKKRSDFQMPSVQRSGFRFLILSLQRSRAELYKRINERVESMFAQGLVSEVRSLIAAGCSSAMPAMQGIGYREFFTADGIFNENTEKVKELIKKNSRLYAKRQQTFFKTFEDALMLDANDTSTGIQKISEFLQ